MNPEEALKDFKSFSDEVEAEMKDPTFATNYLVVQHFHTQAEDLLAKYYTQEFPIEFQVYQDSLERLKQAKDSNNTINVVTLVSWINIIIFDLKIRIEKNKPQLTNHIPSLFKPEHLATIIEHIKKAKLNPLDFKRVIEGRSTKFIYKNSPLYFIFKRHQKQLTYYATSNTMLTGDFELYQYLVNGVNKEVPFIDALARMSKWMAMHVLTYEEYLNTPDPWSELFKKSTSQNNFEDDNVKIPIPEQTTLKLQLDNLQEAVRRKFNIVDNNLDHLNAAIINLKDKLDKLSKPSWQRFAKGLFIDLVTDIGTDKDNIGEIKEFIKEQINEGDIPLPPLL